MLEFAGVPYMETAFTKDTWPAHKRIGTESKLYTFGQGTGNFSNRSLCSCSQSEK